MKLARIFVFVWFSIGLLVGLAINRDRETQAELEAKYTAYRHCLENAGALSCRMTPADFVEYYRIKNKLEAMKNDRL